MERQIVEKGRERHAERDRERMGETQTQEERTE